MPTTAAVTIELVVHGQAVLEFTPGTDASAAAVAHCHKWKYVHAKYVDKWHVSAPRESGIMRFGYAIVDGDKTLGVLFGQATHDRTVHNGIEIQAMVVDPDARRRGVGTQLLQAAAYMAKCQGLEQLLGEAFPSSMPFYESAGWVPAGIPSSPDPNAAALMDWVTLHIEEDGDYSDMATLRELCATVGGIWMKKVLW